MALDVEMMNSYQFFKCIDSKRRNIFTLIFNFPQGEVRDVSEQVQKISGKVRYNLWGGPEGAHLLTPPLKIRPWSMEELATEHAEHRHKQPMPVNNSDETCLTLVCMQSCLKFDNLEEISWLVFYECSLWCHISCVNLEKIPDTIVLIINCTDLVNT